VSHMDTIKSANGNYGRLFFIVFRNALDSYH
jgi:hypothetical protein